jgi:hypothetical protein
MDYSFARYLLSKQTVDDRALNKDVVNALRASLPPEPITVIEVGAGIGTMLKRLVTWDLLCTGEYIMVDAMQENIDYAREWIPGWAREAGLSVEYLGQDQLQVRGPGHEIRIRLTSADVFTFIKQNETPADLLIAHAFLDLLPLPESLEKLLQLTNGLAWLTINFDGLSSLQPQLDQVLDGHIEALYHASMDTRSSGGDSRTGRRLFEHLRAVHAEILAAGSSDWVVHARDGKYPADEKRFLQFVLGFFEESLKNSPELEGVAFANWLARRHEQIERGELVYIAHQMDFLIRKHS